jgi:multiple sugar transport system substrate-binding protein
MNAEQREVLNDIIMYMRAGRIKRRTFLERAWAIGLSASMALSLLESCSSVSIQLGCTPKNRQSTPNVLVWESEHDDQAIFSDFVARFRAKYPGVQVVYVNAPSGDNQQYTHVTNILSACNDSIDIASIDIIWLAEYASKGWILPLNDTAAEAVKSKYGEGSQVVASCTYNGTIYSAPLRVDQGVLYYRSDITTSVPPKTWQELVEKAQEAVDKGLGGIVEGYVWQANQYEGLVCDFIEVLKSYGGSILSANNREVTLYRPEAIDALTEMMNWIGTISPHNITGEKDKTGNNNISGYEESDARVRWQNGYAAFMRNWYNAFSIVTDPIQSVVHDAACFSCLPAKTARAGEKVTGYSCLGGWQLAVNGASQNRDLAWQFIKEALSDATMASLDPSEQPTDKARSDISIADIKEHVVIRPTVPNYPSKDGISEHLQASLYRALTQANQGKSNKDIAAAELKALEAELKPLLQG